MPSVATRPLRGAAAGALAAGVWALQQPVDMRIFAVPYDDVEFLGSAVTGRRATAGTRVAGTALHLAAGGLFGAVYSTLPGRGPLKGVAAGLIEHAASWPATRVAMRRHPLGATFPNLWGERRAFAQAAWRHALFGLILGTLEARLNQPREEAVLPAPDPGSNGHAPFDAVIVATAE